MAHVKNRVKETEFFQKKLGFFLYEPKRVSVNTEFPHQLDTQRSRFGTGGWTATPPCKWDS